MKAKIAFGGGCHWCTEAVFQSLIGVVEVAQGYVASTGENSALSEAVIVTFDDSKITLEVLIEIHVHTHKSTSNHSMRAKYRSAVYTFNELQKVLAKAILMKLQVQFKDKLITKVMCFSTFKPSRTQIQNYYYNNPNKPFCERFVNPKLIMLLERFANHTDKNKLKHLKNEKGTITHPK